MKRDSLSAEEKIAVILLNYRGAEDTVNCIESLICCDGVSSIFVVDNDSPDDSLSILHSYIDAITRHRVVIPVILVANGRNGGFAAGTNTGIRNAILQGYTLFWVLNNDTIVRKDSLRYMIEEYQQHDNALVGSELRYFDSPDKVQCFGGGTISTIKGRVEHLVYKGKPDFLTGASMLFGKTLFNATGGFDEGFFMYWEDVDFCTRAIKNGATLCVTEKSVILHKVSPATKKMISNHATFQEEHSMKGLVRYARRHWPYRWWVPVTIRLTRVMVSRILHHHGQGCVPIIKMAFKEVVR